MTNTIEVAHGHYAWTRAGQEWHGDVLYTRNIGTDVVLLIYEPREKFLLMARQIDLSQLQSIYDLLLKQVAKDDPIFQVHFIGGEPYDQATDYLRSPISYEEKSAYICNHPGRKYTNFLLEKMSELSGGTLTRAQKNDLWQIKPAGRVFKGVAMDIVEKPHPESLAVHPLCRDHYAGVYKLVHPLPTKDALTHFEQKVLQQESIAKKAMESVALRTNKGGASLDQEGNHSPTTPPCTSFYATQSQAILQRESQLNQ